MRITESTLRKMIREQLQQAGLTPAWISVEDLDRVFENVVDPQIGEDYNEGKFVDADEDGQYEIDPTFDLYAERFMEALGEDEKVNTAFENATGLDPMGDGNEQFAKELEAFVQENMGYLEKKVEESIDYASEDASSARDWQETMNSLMPGRI